MGERKGVWDLLMVSLTSQKLSSSRVLCEIVPDVLVSFLTLSFDSSLTERGTDPSFSFFGSTEDRFDVGFPRRPSMISIRIGILVTIVSWATYLMDRVGRLGQLRQPP